MVFLIIIFGELLFLMHILTIHGPYGISSMLLFLAHYCLSRFIISSKGCYAYALLFPTHYYFQHVIIFSTLLFITLHYFQPKIATLTRYYFLRIIISSMLLFSARYLMHHIGCTVREHLAVFLTDHYFQPKVATLTLHYFLHASLIFCMLLFLAKGCYAQTLLFFYASLFFCASLFLMIHCL